MHGDEKTDFMYTSIIYAALVKREERNLYRRMLSQNRFEVSLLSSLSKKPWISKMPVRAITLLETLALPCVMLATALMYLRIVKRLRMVEQFAHPVSKPDSTLL